MVAFFELAGVFIAGAAAGLLIWALGHALKGRLPRWLVPAGAGLAMLIAAVSNDYGWFSRARAALPEGMEVALSVEQSALWRPWSYLAPLTTRFIAVDVATARRHPDHPDQVLTDLYLHARWSPPVRAPVLFDCAGARRADLIDGAEFGPDGAVVDAAWRRVNPDDDVLATACHGAPP